MVHGSDAVVGSSGCDTAGMAVDTIQFLPMDRMILMKSAQCVSLQSPYQNGPSGWHWVVPRHDTNAAAIITTISHVEYLPKANLVAMVQYMSSRSVGSDNVEHNSDESRIHLVDATTGEMVSPSAITEPIRGAIQRISFVEHSKNTMSFSIITSQGDMLCLSNLPAQTSRWRPDVSMRDDENLIENHVTPTTGVMLTLPQQMISFEANHDHDHDSKRPLFRRRLLSLRDLSDDPMEEGTNATVDISRLPPLRGSYVRQYMERRF